MAKDWLYECVFAEIRANRDAMQKQVSGRINMSSGPPEHLRIQECGSIRWQEVICLPPIVREWTCSGEEFREQRPSDPEPPDLGTRCNVGSAGGALFAIAVVRFHIAADRKKVAMNVSFGPLYARGYVMRVQGQGATGTLVRDTEANGWFA